MIEPAATRLHLLQELRKSFEQGSRPSEVRMETLLSLCRDPRQAIREAALTLLLEPPVSDELFHFKALLSSLEERSKPIGDLPPALIELLCERIALLRKLPGGRSGQSFWSRLLRGLPRASLQGLCSKPYPLDLFLPLFTPQRRGAPGGTGARARVFKRRSRLLCRRLAAAPAPQPWAELTLADLPWGAEGEASRRRKSSGTGRWLRVGRALLAPPLPSVSAPRVPLPLSRAYWGGFGGEALRTMDALLECQAGELRAVRDLACRVSRRLRRVVLSWHNATLAAASGWAFEDLGGFFPSRDLFQRFEDAVADRLSRLERRECEAPSGVDRLRDLREKRLVAPKVLHALWENRVRCTLDPSLPVEAVAEGERFFQSVRLAGEAIDPAAVDALGQARFSWPTVVRPHQRIPLEELVQGLRDREKHWSSGLLLLAALIEEAQQLLDCGLLDAFVLPWIDKFFISSRREEDRTYLPALLTWLEGQGLDPLVLFWEDTSHVQAPSFQLVLDQWRARGHPYRGIGIFDAHRSGREQAEAIVARESDRTRLFALRPFGEVHTPVSFDRLLKERDRSFLRAYDSAWKDNLCFLYAGTRVLPLVSIQCEAESFPAWIVLEGRKVPFGAYFRGRLRREVVGSFRAESNGLSRSYTRWANLD